MNNKLARLSVPKGRLSREESQSRDTGPERKNTADRGEVDFSDTRTAGKGARD